MRRGDLIPIVLIGGIATFVAVQGVKIRRATQRAGAPSAVVQAASASAIAPQGSANVAAANRSPRPSGTIAVEGSVELRQSGEPAPERDAAATRRQIQE